MNGRFAGRGVIVTGGGRGIGQATARAFAAEGADVLVLGRTVADLEDTVAQITADGGQAWLLPCDVTARHRSRRRSPARPRAGTASMS